MSASYKIAVIGGDGTGPEVAREGVKVIKAAAVKFGFKPTFEDYDYGGDRYIRTGEVLPESAADEMRAHDAIFLGAIGHPETLGAWFDRIPDSLILDQRLFWVTLLILLVIRGAGPLSLDRLLVGVGFGGDQRQ